VKSPPDQYADPKYTKGRGLKDLTEKGFDLLIGCCRANPEGCRSADGECGPVDRYGTRPCHELAGVSLEDQWKLHKDLQEIDSL
jgi:hypothetical protein